MSRLSTATSANARSTPSNPFQIPRGQILPRTALTHHAGGQAKKYHHTPVVGTHQQTTGAGGQHGPPVGRCNAPS